MITIFFLSSFFSFIMSSYGLNVMILGFSAQQLFTLENPTWSKNFLNQTRTHHPAYTWFLKISFVRDVSMRVCACVFMSLSYSC